MSKHLVSCLVSLSCTLVLLFLGFFALHGLGLGHPPEESVRETIVIGFAVTAHITAEHALRRFSTCNRRLSGRLHVALRTLLTFALLFTAFFVAYSFGLGHHPGECLHETVVASFAISVHLSVQHWVHRIVRQPHDLPSIDEEFDEDTTTVG